LFHLANVVQEQRRGPQHLTLQNSDAVVAAVERFRRRPAGHLPLGTFDRDLAKLDGVERL